MLVLTKYEVDGKEVKVVTLDPDRPVIGRLYDPTNRPTTEGFMFRLQSVLLQSRLASRSGGGRQ